MNPIGNVFDQEELHALYQSMAEDYPGWVHRFVRRFLDEPEGPGLGEQLTRVLLSTEPEVTWSFIQAVFETDTRPLLSSARVPVLILQARNDFLFC